MDKVVLIFEQSFFYAKHEAEFGMDKVKKSGYDVELWTVAPWNFGWENPQIPDLVDDKEIVILSRTQFIDNMNRVKNDRVLFLAYPYHAYNYMSYIIRKTIVSYGFDFLNLAESPCLLNGSVVPSDNYFRFTKKRMVRLIKESIKAILLTCLGKFDEIKNVHATFWGPIVYKSRNNLVPSKLCYNSFPLFNEVVSKRNILLNTADYSRIKKLSFSEKTNEDYIVFVDQGMTQYITLPGERPLIENPEIYFRELNSFFDYIEKKTGYEVIIAVHPKAKYVAGEYGNRKLVYGKTGELIKNSQFCIHIFSTSLNYNFFWKIPFVCLYSSQFTFDLSVFDGVLEMLGGKRINISEPYGNIDDMVYRIPDESYDKLKNLYLVDDEGVEDKTQAEFVCDYVSSYFSDLNKTSNQNAWER